MFANFTRHQLPQWMQDALEEAEKAFVAEHIRSLEEAGARYFRMEGVIYDTWSDDDGVYYNTIEDPTLLEYWQDEGMEEVTAGVYVERWLKELPRFRKEAVQPLVSAWQSEYDSLYWDEDGVGYRPDGSVYDMSEFIISSKEVDDDDLPF